MFLYYLLLLAALSLALSNNPLQFAAAVML